VNTSFKMVALGDSIMWGQGLFEYQKIHALVVAELVSQGFDVECVFLAHSGAVIGEPDTPSDLPPLDGPFANEVPVGEPTIFEQIETALGGKERDESVRLVLLNGGINDVDTTRVINLANLNLDKEIEDAFYRKMKLLLEKVCRAFPKAIIMVAGFYKFFSEKSEENMIQNYLKMIGFNLPLVPDVIGEKIVNLFSSVFTDSFIQRAAHFRDYSHQCMREAIVDLTGAMPEVVGRIVFVDPLFEDENAIGASEALVFGINPDFSPQDPPEIAEGRREACERHADRLSPLREFAAPRASVAHPNAQGAQQYAKVILTSLAQVM
jgi:hypothetical protein